MTYLNANEALIKAVVEQDLDSVIKALSNGADVNYQDYATMGGNYGATPLSESAWHASDDIFYLLLNHKKVSVDLPDESSATALHKVIAMGNIERTQALLDKGADINALDNAGKNALDTANECEQHDIAKLLENHSKAPANTQRPKTKPAKPKFR